MVTIHLVSTLATSSLLRDSGAKQQIHPGRSLQHGYHKYIAGVVMVVMAALEQFPVSGPSPGPVSHTVSRHCYLSNFLTPNILRLRQSLYWFSEPCLSHVISYRLDTGSWSKLSCCPCPCSKWPRTQHYNVRASIEQFLSTSPPDAPLLFY